MIDSGFDDNGHAHEIDIDAIECVRCGDLYEMGDMEGLDGPYEELLDAVYEGRTIQTGEILSYYPGLINPPRVPPGVGNGEGDYRGR